MINIIADVGSPNANSLVSYDRAVEIVAERIEKTAWTSASEDDRKAALIRASRRFNSLPWKGSRSYPGQSQSFPRIGLLRDGEAVDPTTTPIEIEYGVVDLAYSILKGDVLSKSIVSSMGITDLEVEGAVAITFDKSSFAYKSMPDEILAEIPSDWLKDPADDEPFIFLEGIV